VKKARFEALAITNPPGETKAAGCVPESKLWPGLVVGKNPAGLGGINCRSGALQAGG